MGFINSRDQGGLTAVLWLWFTNSEIDTFSLIISSLLLFQLGAAGEDNVFWFRGNSQQGSCFIKDTDTPQSLKMTRDDSTLLSFDPFEIIVRSLSVISNLKKTFVANLETSTCIEDEISRLTNTFPRLKSSGKIRQLFVLPRNKQIVIAPILPSLMIPLSVKYSRSLI